MNNIPQNKGNNKTNRNKEKKQFKQLFHIDWYAFDI